MHIVELISTRDGQIMETLRQYRNKTVLAALEKNISCTFCYSFVCLCCVVPVSIHYRLCLVTVCMKVL